MRRYGVYFWTAAAAGAVAALARRYGTDGSSRLYSAARRLLESEGSVASKARCITIQRRPEEVFRAWRDFENMTRFVPYLTSIEETQPSELICKVNLPKLGASEWKIRIFDERENESMSWATADDSQLKARGRIRFAPAPADRGTEVTLEVEYGGNRAGEVLAKLTAVGMRQTLRRLKQWVETGEIATVTGQPSARQPERQRPELRETAARFLQSSRGTDQTLLDQALEDTFPASDPPAFGTGG